MESWLFAQCSSQMPETHTPSERNSNWHSKMNCNKVLFINSITFESLSIRKDGPIEMEHSNCKDYIAFNVVRSTKIPGLFATNKDQAPLEWWEHTDQVHHSCQIDTLSTLHIVPEPYNSSTTYSQRIQIDKWKMNVLARGVKDGRSVGGCQIVIWFVAWMANGRNGSVSDSGVLPLAHWSMMRDMFPRAPNKQTRHQLHKTLIPVNWTISLRIDPFKSMSPYNNCTHILEQNNWISKWIDFHRSSQKVSYFLPLVRLFHNNANQHNLKKLFKFVEKMFDYLVEMTSGTGHSERLAIMWTTFGQKNLSNWKANHARLVIAMNSFEFYSPFWARFSRESAEGLANPVHMARSLDTGSDPCRFGCACRYNHGDHWFVIIQIVTSNPLLGGHASNVGREAHSSIGWWWWYWHCHRHGNGNLNGALRVACTLAIHWLAGSISQPNGIVISLQ